MPKRDYKRLGMMIEYIDAHMKLKDIVKELQIKTRDWVRWTEHGRNPQIAMEREIKKLYEKLIFPHTVKRLIDTYVQNYPNPDRMRLDFERDPLDDFWFCYGLWLSRDDIFDDGVNRLGEIDPEWHPQQYPLKGYSDELTDKFDRLIQAGKYLESLDI